MRVSVSKQKSQTRGPHFDQIVFWILVSTGVLATVASIFSMMHAGISWDSRVDMGQSLVIRNDVARLPADGTLQDAYGMVYFTSEFYGILIPQLGDLLFSVITGSMLGNTGELLQVNDMAAYRLQGLANIAMAAAAAGVLSFAVASALKSRNAGAFAGALIMTTPLYFGMSSMNVKDMPVAAGLTLVASGFMLNRSARSRRVRWGFAAIVTAAGSSIALATRPGLWPLILIFVVMILGAYGLLDLRNRALKNSIPGILIFVVSAVVTLLFLWWSNPFGRLSLFEWLGDSFVVMRNYPWESTVRTAGVDVISTSLPWWYVPAWGLAQLPVMSTVIVCAALLATIGSILKREWALPRRHVFVLFPLFLQAVVLPVGIILTGATLYDALRHLLFVIPALMGIAAVAIATVEKAKWDRGIAPRIAAGILAVVVVGLSAFATARWIPYSYAFINPIAGLNHPQRDWELDYWGLTAAEGVQRLKSAGYSPIGVLPTEETAVLFGGVSLAGIVEEGQSSPFGLYIFRRWGVSIGDCEPLFTIERDGQILGEGAACPPVASS